MFRQILLSENPGLIPLIRRLRRHLLPGETARERVLFDNGP